MKRPGIYVVRGFHAGDYAPPGRGRLYRFVYGVVVGFLVGAFLFGLGLIRAEEPADGEPAPVEVVEAPRYQPAPRGDRTVQLARAEVVDLAAETFGPEIAGYVANIVRCESTYRPGADENAPYVGLLQVDPYLHAEKVARVVGYRVTAAEAAWLLRDPRVNLMTAVLILREQGFGAWPVCSR